MTQAFRGRGCSSVTARPEAVGRDGTGQGFKLPGSLADFSCAHFSRSCHTITTRHFTLLHITFIQKPSNLTMARQRKEPKKAKDIKLRQPDRSAPTGKTLLQLAEDRNLFNMADKQQRKKKGKDSEEDDDEEEDENDEVEDRNRDDVLSSSADRHMDTLLYSVCLAMLHFTLDFLVQHQYAMEMDYTQITLRALQSLIGELLCFGLSSCWSWHVWLNLPYINQSLQHSFMFFIFTPPTLLFYPGFQKSITMACARSFSSSRAWPPAAT